MMKINRENYEAYFLDYLEGNLSEDQREEVTLFLQQNPDLQSELEAFESVVLEEVEPTTFELKNELKREESTGLLRSDYLMIAEVEGTITAEEKAELAKLVQQSPEKMDDLGFYHKTKLKNTDLAVFPDKATLIQKERKAMVWWSYAGAVAAAVLVLLLLNIGFIQEQYSPQSFSWKEDSSQTEEVIQYNFVAQTTVTPAVQEEALSSQLETPSSSLAQQPKISEKPLVSPSEKEITPALEEEELATIEPIDTKEKKEEESLPQVVVENTSEEILASNLNPLSEPEEEEFVPIKEFAKSKIKDDVLKGKTFSETILDELTASNDKISFEREKDESGSLLKFALNIGKFSISKNK